MVFKDGLKLVSLLFIFGVIATSIINNLGLDISVAQAHYDPMSAFGKFIRDDTMNPIIILSLIFLTSAIVIKKYDINVGNVKLFRQSCLVWVAVVLLGSVVAVNAILKPLTERPRPKHTTILNGEFEFKKPLENILLETNGKSFPSGHSSMGFLLMAPFFLLFLKRHYKLSALFLSLGLVGGVTIGYGRVVLGAHFITDVLWAGIIMMSLSILCAYWVLAKTEDEDAKSLFTEPENSNENKLKNA